MIQLGIWFEYTGMYGDYVWYSTVINNGSFTCSFRNAL